MSDPGSVSSYEADIIKTSAAIVYVIDTQSAHPALRQAAPLTQRQIDELAHWFSDGLDKWDRELKAQRTPNPIDVGRIAIVAGILSQRYPAGIKRDGRGEITLPVRDIIDAWNNLAGDIAQFASVRQRWEGVLYAMFRVTTAPNTGGRNDTTAERVGKLIAKSLGVEGIFNNIFDTGASLEAEVPPLPNYPADDVRSQHLQLMLKLQLELKVTEGLLQTITPDKPHETRAGQLLEWVKQRANSAVETVTHLVIPSGVARFSSQLENTARILNQSRDKLHICLYGTEAQLAAASAQHAVERSVGTIAFLAVCPNIPFVVPTLELRLAFTRPLFYIAKGAHEAMGNLPIVGILFWGLKGVTYAIDAIPRAQVRLVQGTVTDGWLANKNKRDKIILRYLHHVDGLATNPRVDALQRVLLSIVS